MEYFIADTHFGGYDQRICTQPFSSPEEHDEVILNNINKVCGKEDVLWVIGDLVHFGPRQTQLRDLACDTLSEINCEIRLVMGNQEERMLEIMFNGKQDEFYRFMSNFGVKAIIAKSCGFTMRDMQVNLVHNPHDGNNSLLNIYGHKHYAGKISPIGINVGVDCTGYHPIGFPYIREMVKMGASISMGDLTDVKSLPYASGLFKKYYDAWAN